MKNLVKKLSEQKLILNLSTGFLIVLGIFIFLQLPVQPIPRIFESRILITTQMEGASPQETESKVTIPLEKSIAQESGIDIFYSRSMTGKSEIEVWFDSENDFDETLSKIRRKIDNTTLDESAQKPEITRECAPSKSFFILALTSTGEKKELQSSAFELLSALRETEGVAEISTLGMPESEIQIGLSLYSMKNLYVSIDEVLSALKGNNFEIAAGNISENGIDKMITLNSRLETAENIGSTVIRSSFGATPVTLRDVSTISEDFKSEKSQVTFDGSSAVIFQLRLKESANLLKTSRLLSGKIDAFSESETQSEITVLFDESTGILDKIKSSLWALLFVLLILLSFSFLVCGVRHALFSSLSFLIFLGIDGILLKVFGISLSPPVLAGILVSAVPGAAVLLSVSLPNRHFSSKFSTVLLSFGVVFSFILLQNPFTQDGAKSAMIGMASVIVSAFIFQRARLFSLPDLKKRKQIRAMEKGLAHFFRFLWAKPAFTAIAVLALGFLWFFAVHHFEIPAFFSISPDESPQVILLGTTEAGQSLSRTSLQSKSAEEKIRELLPSALFFTESGKGGQNEVFQTTVFLPEIPSASAFCSNIEASLSEEDFRLKAFPVSYEDLKSPEIFFSFSGESEIRTLAESRLREILLSNSASFITSSEENTVSAYKLVINREDCARVYLKPEDIAEDLKNVMLGSRPSSVQTTEEKVDFFVFSRYPSANSLSAYSHLESENLLSNLIPVSLVSYVSSTEIASALPRLNGNPSTEVSADFENGISEEKAYEILFEMQEEYPSLLFSMRHRNSENLEEFRDMKNAALLGLVALLAILLLSLEKMKRLLLVIFVGIPTFLPLMPELNETLIVGAAIALGLISAIGNSLFSAEEDAALTKNRAGTSLSEKLSEIWASAALLFVLTLFILGFGFWSLRSSFEFVGNIFREAFVFSAISGSILLIFLPLLSVLSHRFAILVRRFHLKRDRKHRRQAKFSSSHDA